MATLRSAACRREAPIRSPFRRPDESRDPSCRRHDAERQSHEVAASRNIGSAATPPHAAVLAAPWVPAFAGQTRRALRPERPLSSVARAPPNHHDRRRSLSPQLTAHLMTANQTCGQAAIALLEAHGVDTVFGIPGVHTLEFYRGLAGSRLRHVAVRHEQGAGFMADGYARVSGRPAVCLVITGPGLTNAATAIGQAYSDSVPMLGLSSVNARDDLGKGRGRLHEITSQQAAMAPLTAFSRTIASPAALAPAMDQAFDAFAATRPRPVHLEVPLDVLREPAAP